MAKPFFHARMQHTYEQKTVPVNATQAMKATNNKMKSMSVFLTLVKIMEHALILYTIMTAAV